METLREYIYDYGIKNGIAFFISLGEVNEQNLKNGLLEALTQNLGEGDTTVYKPEEITYHFLNSDIDYFKLSANEQNQKLSEMVGYNVELGMAKESKSGNARASSCWENLDLSNRQYRTAYAVYDKIIKYAKRFNSFYGVTWNDKNIYVKSCDIKVLDLVIPYGDITSQQMIGLKAAKQYLNNQLGMRLNIEAVKVK